MKGHLIPILVLTAAATGCLKLEETLTLRPDGSGIIEVVYTIPEQTVVQLKAAERLEAEMASPGQGLATLEPLEPSRVFFDPDEDRYRALLKPYEKHGVKLEDVKVDSRDAARVVRVKVKFDDLRGLAETQIFKDYGFSLTRTGHGNYQVLREGRKDPDQDQGLKDPEAAKMLAPFFAGFDVRLSVHTPGKIVSSTAPRSSLYQAAWSFKFDRDPRAVQALREQTYKVVFEGQGLSLPEIRLPPAAAK